jgi:radical SAM protein with 4Fe4S-binding SPASM domain
MPEITEWFCNTFQPSIINFENLKSNRKSEGAGIFEPDPILFARQYYRSLSIAEDYGVELVNSAIISDHPQYSSCPVGKDTLIINPDGMISSCYLFPWRWQEKSLDLSVGIIKGREMKVSHSEIIRLREMVKDKPRCSSCFCRWTCAGGCHVDITYPGSDKVYDNFCKQTRILGIIKILRRLNQNDLLDLFLQNDQQIEYISMRRSDKLQDWKLNE